ncbi:MAG: CRISPR-associated endonuclease Cas1, partial [Cyanobacteriota bacterium]
MTILYLTEEGSYLEKRSSRVRIRKTDQTLKELPIEKLEGIVLFGNTHLTTPLMTEFLEREIPMTWLSETGKFYGRLEPTTSINIERQREQFRRADDEIFCFELSKSFISAKIRNCRVLIKRYNQKRNIERVKEIDEELRKQILKVSQADNAVQILGYEGNASRMYFEALSLIVDESFKFKGRSKQPPKDPFNSLLSFGYTLLLYEIYTAIVNKGLHPYASFMHQVRKGHPALASDLIEEWRPTIVDALVINSINKGIITIDDFQAPSDKGGVYLNRHAAKLFIQSFEKRIRSTNSYLDYVDYPLSFRESLQFQVGSLVKA